MFCVLFYNFFKTDFLNKKTLKNQPTKQKKVNKKNKNTKIIKYTTRNMFLWALQIK